VTIAFAELHCHTDFSFLDGASPADDLVERAVELGLSGLAATDHQGLYGAVRFSAAAREAGLHAIVGLEMELVDAAAPDPGGIVVPARRQSRRTLQPPLSRQRPPGHRAPRREDLRGVRPRELGPHLTLLAQDQAGYANLCRLTSAAHLAGSKGVPRFSHQLLAEHRAGLIVLTGCRHGELARRLLVGDRKGAAAAIGKALLRRSPGWQAWSLPGASTSSCSITCCPMTTG